MNKVLSQDLKLNKEYMLFLQEIKQQQTLAQLKAAKSVNNIVLEFYWKLGKRILELQSNNQHWGSKLLEQLSHDLQNANPGASGYSKRNLEYMRLVAITYPDFIAFTQQAAAQLSWSHLQLLLDKFREDSTRREWYASSAIKYGWSRSTLNTHIKSNLYERQGVAENKLSNYKDLLPAPQSDLAHDMLKNPYNFEFLTISNEASEKEIENSLATHITEFLLELGAGFAYVGKQVAIEVDDEMSFIDLLFYHTHLHCYIVCELKAKKFKPADLGQLSYYLAAVDNTIRRPPDNPTIGILLCESHSKIVAEYALKNINAPIGISEYTLSKNLPNELINDLPTIEIIEANLSNFITYLDKKQS